MMKLTDLPIVDLRTDEQKRRDAAALRDNLIHDGRVARRWGYPNMPPPYQVEDWASHWRDGWRWEDEAIAQDAASQRAGNLD